MRHIVRTATVLALAGVVLQEYLARRHYAHTLGPTRPADEEERTAWTPFWREALAPLELALFRGLEARGTAGVPRGTGEPVLLVHGFLVRGGYLSPLRDWLRRIGYRAEIADIGRNADCIDVMTGRLLGVLAATTRGTGRPVHLVGHSLGGVLARAAAAREHGDVASLTMVAAPVRGLHLHPAVRLAAAVVRSITHRRRGATVRPACLTPACDCPSAAALATPLPTDLPQLAIVSRHDGLTDWRYCADPATATVVEVPASHVGLVWNARVCRALADHLAAATRRRPPSAARQP